MYILRINPVFFMSLSIVLIFYYFSRYHSAWAGIYSILVSLSLFMVWVYWAEARPYALWFFLTVLQSTLFMRLIKNGRPNYNLWIALSLTHIFLSLTVTISVIQIAAVSFLLWLMVERNWRKYIVLSGIPLGICIIYYILSPKYDFRFVDGLLSLINASIPKGRFLIIFLFAFYLLLSNFQNIISRLKPWKVNFLDKRRIKESGMYFLFVCLMLAGFSLVILMFKLTEDGFRISNRYFIALAPIGIIATILFSIYLVKAPKAKFGRVIIGLGLSVLLIMRFIRTLGLAGIWRHFNLPYL